jgi:hypothetical protein
MYDWNKGEPHQQPKLAISTQLHVCNTETQQLTSISIKDLAESHKTLETGQNIATEGEKDDSLLPTLQTTNLQGESSIPLHVHKEPTVPTRSHHDDLQHSQQHLETDYTSSHKSNACQQELTTNTSIHWYKTTWTGTLTPPLCPRHFTRQTGYSTHQATR